MTRARAALTASVLVAVAAALPACTGGSERELPDECGGRRVTISGTAGDDVITATSADDVIATGDGDDVVDGLEGDDVICGGEGQDRLDGGPGDDELHGGLDSRESADDDFYRWNADTLVGGPGDDLLDGGVDDRHEPSETSDTIVFSGSPRGVEVDLVAGTATGDGTDRIEGQVRHVEGSPHDDRILGSADDDILYGNEGADELVGRDGSDLLYAGVADSNSRDRSPHVLIGGEGADTLVAESGDDQLRGGGGDDSLQGGAGVDVVRGGPGDDHLLDLLGFAPGQVVDGGPGSGDRASSFGLQLRGRFVRAAGVIHLAEGYLRARFGDTTVEVAFTGLEDVTAPDGRWRLIGDPG
ncbi:calcium-binding protein [Nocardioides sp.]|uniref:calcium-binding protein n=1 Tax=Nocardioides sp. TaxID=35761 RepID=UPI00286A8807|nr:calcium-binding protein [Nocardioides sp.]